MKKYLLLFVTVVFSISPAWAGKIGLVVSSDSGKVVTSVADYSFVNIDATGEAPAVSQRYDGAQVRNFDLDAAALFGEQSTALVPFTTPRPLSPTDAYHIQRAEQLMAKVKTENRFVKFLDQSALIDLPIGVVREGTSDDYAILIDSLVITPSYAYLTVYMCIPVPQSDKKLVFRGDHIRLSNNAGITGDAKIFLVNDLSFKLFGTESQMIVRGGHDNTYAIWDCNGFKETKLVADVEFSRNWIVPVNGTGNVSSHFEAWTTDWNDLVVTVNLEPFSLATLKGTEFHTRNAVFDYSDYHTPGTVQFPDNYTSSQFIGDDKSLWRGFYMEDLTVILPPEFKKQGEDARISFTGQHMLIDNMGFSGSVGVKNLFALNQGDMNGWDYSLDSLGFSFASNDLVGAGFKGKVVLPVGDENKPFRYTAIINPGTTYVFNVETVDELNVDIWNANVMLKKGSYLDVQVAEGKFKPKAILTGSMDIRAQADDMALFDVQFEELTIMTEAPYLDAKAFSLGSERMEHTLKSFPVSISRIGFEKKASDKIALNFNIGIHLTGQDDGAFRGDATIELRSQLHETKRKWRYDGVAVSEVGVDVDGGSYRIKGRIKIFEDDLVYGKGYNGTVALFFQPGFDLTGTVIFGKVDGYRYWYADAFVGFPTGIPFCGFLAFYGFGGGMYHNMEQVGFSNDQRLSAGRSLSGVVYRPNKEVRYGLKATIQIGLTSSKDTFNGDATFEVSFNRSGGVRRISLVGNAYVLMSQELGDMEEITAMVEKMSQHKDSYGMGEPGDIRTTSGLKPPGKDALISGHLFQYYDFENDVLHGEMEMYVDVFGALKGTGPNGLAGWSVVHYSRDEWFIYIGTPERRVGLRVLGLMTMDGYFMTGDEIPGSPPPPAQVSSILGDLDLDYMRDENALGTGRGVAFGGSFLFDTGDRSFHMFYGRFAMGAGFDVMLKNYGDEVRCKGKNSTLGINGWYANGQTYAFVEGKIGIKVKLFFKTKKVEILNVGAAVVFQAKLPNPVWMKGVVGGRFSVLGGLVKGHCKFELEIGDKCEIIDGSVLEGLDVIADITPMQGGTAVDVFTTPQAVFNLEIDKEFQMIDVDDVKKTFRITLDHFSVKDGAEVLAAALKWNPQHTVLAYDNIEILPPGKELIAEVKVVFEEKVNGRWTRVKLRGKEATEERSVTFTTGEAPDYIPHHNVAYSYPQIGQYNFYPNEYKQGYIKLKKGQAYLFKLPEVWIQRGRFISATGETHVFDIGYADSQVNFTIPSKILNDKAYALEIINLPKGDNAGALDRNITTVSNQVTVEGVAIDTEITSKKAEGNISTLKETRIYKSFFRTSVYNTFNEKLDNLKISSGWIKRDSRGQAIHILGTNISALEYFDMLELKAVNGNNALVSIVANLDHNQYYQNQIYPLVYEDYQSLTVPPAKLESRDLSLGIPPVRAVYIQQTPQQESALSEQDWISGNLINGVRSANFIYELAYYMKADYYDLQAKTARFFAHQRELLNTRRRRILETPFPVLSQGNYQVDITYRLPGINKVTTKREYTIYNPFK